MSLRTSIPVILLGSLVVLSAYAQAAGPVVPGGNNTSMQYCRNSICSFAGQNYLNESNYNATIGQYPVGLYPNGVYSSHSFLIGIQESQTCDKLLQLHLHNNCIPYDKVKVFDNTNPVIAGQWVNDSGYYHRLAPRVLNHYKFNQNRFVIMVDPNPDFTAMARMVYLNDGNFTWINPDDNSSQGQLTITHLNRSVLNCDTATVAPNLWLINDTIHYMESGCIKTSYNDTRFTYHAMQPFLMDTNNMKTVNWLSHFGNVTRTPDCITKKCDIQTDPFHNHDPKFGW